ncbi:MAG TPA: hypothetical protein VIG24_13420 [Acidimicrobiia bacterium]
MAITQQVFTLGTVTETIVAPSVDAARVTIKNLQPEYQVGAYSRDGYVFLLSRTFSVPSPGTVTFSLATPPGGVQFDFYSILTTDAQVTATLIEGGTVVSAGTPIPAYNLNRQVEGAHAAVLDTATSVTGGTVIATELVPGENKASGGLDSSKIFTLLGSSTYAMRFVNNGNQSTTVGFDLGFSEQFNGAHDVWLGLPDGAMLLKGSEEVQLALDAGESVVATGGGTPVKVAVIRQD